MRLSMKPRTGGAGFHSMIAFTVLLYRNPDCLGIDPDLSFLHPHRIAPQRRARPSGGDMSVVKIERGKMARAKQPALGNPAETEVGLFMRTGPFAGKNPVAIANQQQIDGLQPRADDGLVRQPVQRTDRNPIFALRCRRHNSGGSQIATRIGVGLKPLHGLLTCGQLEITKITSMSAVIST
jgi:hypothetical protein